MQAPKQENRKNNFKFKICMEVLNKIKENEKMKLKLIFQIKRNALMIFSIKQIFSGQTI
jgi:hypothetical protein